MDNLFTLMQMKEYKTVIALTNDTTDNASLFYRIAAFTALNQIKDALDVIIKFNAQLIDADFPRTIRFHIELLIASFDFDGARDALNKYMDMPYHSQIVEESFAFYKKFIQEQEKAYYRFNGLVSDEKVFEELKDSNDDVILGALEVLRKKDINPFLHILSNLLVNPNRRTAIRSYALMLLVDKKVDMLLKFLAYDGSIIEVNPSTLNQPFNDETFKNVISYIESSEKNTVIIDNVKSLISSLVIALYPNPITENRKVVIASIIYLAKLYLKEKPNLETESSNVGADLTKVKDFTKKVELILKNF